MERDVIEVNGVVVERRFYARNTVAEAFAWDLFRGCVAKRLTVGQMEHVFGLALVALGNSGCGSRCLSVFREFDKKQEFSVYGQGGRLLFRATYERKSIFSRIKSFLRWQKA